MINPFNPIPPPYDVVETTYLLYAFLSILFYIFFLILLMIICRELAEMRGTLKEKEGKK